MGRNLALAIFVILAGANARGAELRLRDEATVAGGMVRLGDVVEIVDCDPADAALLERVLLFPAPAAGKKRIARRGEIVELLALSDIDVKRFPLAGAEQIVVGRQIGESAAAAKSAPAGVEQSVEHALVSYLQQHQPGDVAWSVAPAIPSRFLSPLKQAEQITVAGGKAPFTGRQRFELVARVAGHERRIPIEAEVAALPLAVVVVRPVARGEVIEQENVETQPIADAIDGGDRLLAFDEVVGREATTGLMPGRPITASQVQLPRLVHRGDRVTVHSLAAGVSITTSGKSTQEGALGDSVTVELEDPKREILARVSGPLRVEIGDRGKPGGEASAGKEPATFIPPGEAP